MHPRADTTPSQWLGRLQLNHTPVVFFTLPS
jgi:hypothetical protein